jgi:hypothetical protein
VGDTPRLPLRRGPKAHGMARLGGCHRAQDLLNSHGGPEGQRGSSQDYGPRAVRGRR